MPPECEGSRARSGPPIAGYASNSATTQLVTRCCSVLDLFKRHGMLVGGPRSRFAERAIVHSAVSRLRPCLKRHSRSTTKEHAKHARTHARRNPRAVSAASRSEGGHLRQTELRRAHGWLVNPSWCWAVGCLCGRGAREGTTLPHASACVQRRSSLARLLGTSCGERGRATQPIPGGRRAWDGRGEMVSLMCSSAGP